MNTKKHIFFGGLNELRAIAAFAVILHHMELFKCRDKLSSLFDSKYIVYFIEHLGKNGVYLFFVLSGFLITYLLLSEKNKNNHINFQKFYLRRIFRIWPLYYIIFLISFILIPFLANSFALFSNTFSYYNLVISLSEYDLNTILLYALFLPNVALHEGKVIVGASQSWSVGVEEQFYIVWPLIISFFTRKLLIIVFGAILITFMMINFKFYNTVFNTIITIIPFEYMAIGSMGGYFYSEYSEIITKYTKSRFIYIAVLLLVGFLITVPVFKPYIQNLFLGFVFLLLILVSINQSNPAPLRNKYFSFLGNISYGIYMYHPFVMFLLFPVFYKILAFYNNIFVFNLGIYICVPVLTVAISHLSFRYVEKRFIKIKDSKFKAL
ncbi:acyltransferase family protein [Chryseobacterium lathyri]|uniref:acyltransferase family protein n=1 Tax=Chryseobacterium lathyri TaxID=395933 RepID=UPI002785A481|nr:acyltransferase [Chryseobacterium lathyri]MDQ0066439.1 peptidoglycan/LPS O-acetylase OafA/YrhL [Chryseobacterium lathyri]